jgi:ribosomal protein S18 acetylase RimI-like enzyme
VPDRCALLMNDAACAGPITIRPAVSADADGIARIFVESAEHHAGFDPERYSPPTVQIITARYEQGRQHPPNAVGGGITFVAELSEKVVGFIDSRLELSPDPMHRKSLYCYIAEFAVSSRHRNRGVGKRLLHAAEGWGRGKGAEFACLEYHVANIRAHSLYERLDYRPASTTVVKRL